MNPAAHILAVDDDAKARMLLRNLLESEGYAPLLAGSGEEAIHLAAEHKPDIVLLDVMMPGMDGFATCRKLRDCPAVATVPILMLTALDDRKSRLDGLAAGADDFLSKPIDSVELKLRLKTLTRLNRYKRLNEEVSRFQAAVEHAPDGFLLAELDGTLVMRNPAFIRLFPSDVRNLPNLSDYLPADQVELLRQDAELRFAGVNPTSRECPLLKAIRPDSVVEVTAGLVPWLGRTILQLQLRDLTDRKILEAQLLRSERIELLGQLSGAVVHDMNNVLAVIGGNASILEITAGPSAEKQLANIQGAVDRGCKMLRQLLLFARGADGEIEPVRVQKLVEEVADLLRDSFGSSYQIETQLPDDLPLLEADSTQLHQILMNLCVNARDAMPRGGRLCIEAGTVTLDEAQAVKLAPDARAGQWLALGVRDSGTGIPPEVKARLFDPFFTTKPKGKGTGLGLATVLRLTRRHSGFVTLQTELGVGSCFTCHFPLKTPNTGAATPQGFVETNTAAKADVNA